MNGKINYEFSAKIWRYESAGGWYFVSLPEEMSSEIRKHLQWQEEGWGRMKATAEIGNSRWDTAIWFDSKHTTYVLPLKAEVRKKERLSVDSEIHVRIWI